MPGTSHGRYSLSTYSFFQALHKQTVSANSFLLNDSMGGHLAFAILALVGFPSTLASPIPQSENIKGNESPPKDDDKADSAIESSTDVWAMLVANIVPLLVLLGEKHVKAYFKTMRKRSHYLIYAIGPIGLVTAVVTLIRILPERHRWLKKLIGRQYERRAEVLSDVSSVSCGSVKTEYKGGALEQTTAPDEEDVAICFLQGKSEGNADETFKAIGRFWEKAESIYKELLEPFESKIPTQSGQFILSYSFRCRNVSKARMLAINAYQAPTDHFFDNMSQDMVTKADEDGEDRVDGLAATFTCLTGISLGLTSVRLRDSRWRQASRYIVSLICILIYAAAITLNYLKQQDLQNTIMTATGLLASILGAFYTAMMVDRLSVETSFTVKGLNIIKAGFYSQSSEDWGRQFKEIPEDFIISSDSKVVERREAQKKAELNDYEFRELGKNPEPELAPLVQYWKTGLKDGVKMSKSRGLEDWLTLLVSLCMVGAYIVLYVGLRTAKFWCSLAIFGSSGLASLARSWSVPDMMEFEKEESNYERLTPAFPFTYKAPKNNLKSEIETFFWDKKESTYQDAIAIQNANRIPADRAANQWGTRQQRYPTRSRLTSVRYEVIAGLKKAPISFDSSHESLFSNMRLFKQNEHIYSALRLTIALRKAFLVPAEMIIFRHDYPGYETLLKYPHEEPTLDPEGLICPVFSDIITEKLISAGSTKYSGYYIVRQPLEVLTYTCNQGTNHWGISHAYTYSDEDGKNGSEALGVTMWDFLITYKTWLWRADANFRNEAMYKTSETVAVSEGVNFSRFCKGNEEVGILGLRTIQTLWMATKLAYLTFRGWPLDKLESYLASLTLPVSSDKLASEENVSKVLEFAAASQLYVDVSSRLPELTNQAMDYAISGQRWFDCMGANEVAPTPFGDLQPVMTGRMFEDEPGARNWSGGSFKSNRIAVELAAAAERS